MNLLDPASSNYNLSLANRTFDYIQAGLPSIHMDFPEYRTINNSFKIAELVPEYTLQAARHAVLKMTTDLTYYSKLQDNCFLAAKHYNWSIEKEKLINIYKKCLKC